jgi:hypothetical protein
MAHSQDLEPLFLVSRVTSLHKCVGILHLSSLSLGASGSFLAFSSPSVHSSQAPRWFTNKACFLATAPFWTNVVSAGEESRFQFSGQPTSARLHSLAWQGAKNRLSSSQSGSVTIQVCYPLRSHPTKNEGVPMSLESIREAIKEEISKLNQVLQLLEGGATTAAAAPGRRMSAAARARIGAAQKARWAKARGQAPRPRRKLSAAGRARIAAAQKARWAKIRAAKK